MPSLSPYRVSLNHDKSFDSHCNLPTPGSSPSGSVLHLPLAILIPIPIAMPMLTLARGQRVRSIGFEGLLRLRPRAHVLPVLHCLWQPQ